jgi:hypothetical protein
MNISGTTKERYSWAKIATEERMREQGRVAPPRYPSTA